MLKNKHIGLLAASVIALFAWSGSAFATPVTVGGVTLDRSSPIDLTIQSINLRETSISAPGDVLTGYGQVGSIDSNTSFCNSCNLTFTFQYTVQSITPTATGNDIVFSGGLFNFYVSPTGDFNPLDPSTADSGSLWVQLTGHSYFNTSFASNGALFSKEYGTPTNPIPGSSGTGYLDVVSGSGPAARWLNTDTQHVLADGTLADFYLNSEFNYFPANTCPTVTTDPGNLCSYPITGTGTLTGRTNVPEPAGIGLLGLGLGFLGLALHRRRKDSDARA